MELPLSIPLVLLGVVFLLTKTAFGGIVMDEDSEYIMIYANGTDKGTYYGKETADFKVYFGMDKVQRAITAAKNELAEHGRTITGAREDDAAIAIWNEMGHLGPYLKVTEEDEALVPVVEDLYNTDGDFTGVPNIVFIMLDDAGWNDVDLGLVSTKYEGLFPNINKLVKDEGITLTNYLTGAICCPARGMFLTGKYSSILGMDTDSELQTEDVTLAHELKSAGYSTALIGKYGLVDANPLATPSYKGFDYFYGFYGSAIDKLTMELIPGTEQDSLRRMGYTGSFVELYENDTWVDGTGGLWLSDSLTQKAKDWLTSIQDEETPFFLYYASDLPHTPLYEARDKYADKCVSAVESSLGGVCEYMLAVDELLASLICHISDMGEDVLENTLFVFASDNGGATTSTNVPYAGAKYYMTRGGYSAPAAIFGSLVPEELRGTTYDDLFHVTDWIPTLMHAATRGTWKGPMSGHVIDGVDQWGAVLEADGTAPRTSSIQYIDSADRMTLVIEMDGGYSLSYHKGTAWADVDDTDDTVSLVDYSVHVAECAVDTFSASAFAATQLESASALLERVTRHAGAASDSTRFIVVMVGVLAVVMLVYKSRTSKRASMSTDTDSKLTSSDMPGLSYGTV